jgi:hypothetical protein
MKAPSAGNAGLFLARRFLAFGGFSGAAGERVCSALALARIQNPEAIMVLDAILRC